MSTACRGALRRPVLVRALTLGCLLPTALTGAAHAAAVTVDDDRADCPTAEFTSLPEAVAASAQYDTIYVCAGTYGVPSEGEEVDDPGDPPNPSAGLKIEKNLSIVGAGADEVFIEPDDPAAWVPAAVPSERDDFGNVIAVKRRLVELVEIRLSGFTVRSAGAPVEAGIAIVDVIDAQLSGIRVEGIAPADGTGAPLPGTGPYEPGVGPLAGSGHGIVLANTLQAQSPDEPYTHRATVTGSEVLGYNKAGIVVDARRPNGTLPAGAAFLATITDTRITGAPAAPIGQDGIQVWAGADARIVRNEITGNGNPTPGVGDASAGVLLRSPGPGTVVGGQPADGNNLFGNKAYGIFHGFFLNPETQLPDGVTEQPQGTFVSAAQNWWGPMPTPNPPTAPSASPVPRPTLTTPTDPERDYANFRNVDFVPPADSRRPTPVLAAGFDAAPTVQWDLPRAGLIVPPGQPVGLAAIADDDFSVSSVSFAVDGIEVGSSTGPQYAASWTPTEGDRGATKTLTATATDNRGQQTTATRTIAVTPPPPPTTPDPMAPGSGGVTGPAPTPGGDPVALPITSVLPGAVSPVSPARPPSRSRVAILVGRGLRVRDGGVPLVLSCPRSVTEACRTTVTLRMTVAGRVLTARRTVTLVRNRPTRVTVRLPATARRQLSRRRSLSVRVAITGRAGPAVLTGGKTVAVRR